MASIPFNLIPLISKNSLQGSETFPIESEGVTYRTSIKDILSINQSITGSAIKSLTIDSTHLKPSCVNTGNIVPGSITTSLIQGRAITGPQVALKTLSAEHIVPDASFVPNRTITADKLSGVSKVRPRGIDERNGFPESGTNVLSAITQNSAPIFGVRAWGMIEFTNPTTAGDLKYTASIKSGGNVDKAFTTGWTSPAGEGWSVVKVKFVEPMPTEYYSINITSGPFVDGDHTYQVLFQDKSAFYFTSWDPGAGNSFLQKVDVGGYPKGLYGGAHAPYYYSTSPVPIGVPLATWTANIDNNTQGWAIQNETWFKPADVNRVYGSSNNMTISTSSEAESISVNKANASFVYFTVVC